MIDRRHLLKGIGAAGALSGMPWASLAMAAAETDKRVIFILQRGAQDGLSALVPYEDPNYRAYRPRIALPKPGEEGGVLDLNGLFGLHPSLTTFHQQWQAGDLAILPAIASRYRERSHFDGQNLLENGTGEPFGARDGFLNRALIGLGGPEAKLGMSFGQTVPLALQGEASILSWAPSVTRPVSDDFLERLLLSYGEDEALTGALEEAMMPVAADIDMTGADRYRAAAGKDMALAAAAAASAMIKDNGPRVALLESNGWDTHSGAIGRLGYLFAGLDEAMATLHHGLAPVWDKTLIVTMSEFGRTAHENGSAGTDHGTGGVSFVAGGAVNGGRILGDWPGLSEDRLYEGRDLAPANALESLLKTVLVGHLGIDRGFVEREVLPGSADDRPMGGLLA